MKRTILALLLLVCVGCQPQHETRIGVPKERPLVNPPPAIRQSNWVGNQREGSCVIATTITLLRWQGRNNMAEYWRHNYANGQTADSLAAKFEASGVRYAYTDGNNDVSFLEWAISTRRGCGVVVQGGQHMIALVHLDSKWACLLDDNSVSSYIWTPRERFLAEWKASGSWSYTVVYDPAAPLPPKRSK